MLILLALPPRCLHPPAPGARVLVSPTPAGFEITTAFLVLIAFLPGGGRAQAPSAGCGRAFLSGCYGDKAQVLFPFSTLTIKSQARNGSPRCSVNQPGTYPFLKILIEGNSCKLVGKPSASGTEHRLDN